MRGKNIIDCLCYMGNTEHCGTITINDADFADKELADAFDTLDGQGLIYDGEVKSDTSYIYSYEERLVHPKRGEVGADIVVEITNENRVLKNKIYLYEIE